MLVTVRAIVKEATLGKQSSEYAMFEEWLSTRVNPNGLLNMNAAPKSAQPPDRPSTWSSSFLQNITKHTVTGHSAKQSRRLLLGPLVPEVLLFRRDLAGSQV